MCVSFNLLTREQLSKIKNKNNFTKTRNFFELKNFFPEINLDFLFHSNSSIMGTKISEKKQNYFFKFYYFSDGNKILKKTKLFFNLFRARIQIIKTLNNFSMKKKILFYFPYIEILLSKLKRKIARIERIVGKYLIKAETWCIASIFSSETKIAPFQK